MRHPRKFLRITDLNSSIDINVGLEFEKINLVRSKIFFSRV